MTRAFYASALLVTVTLWAPLSSGQEIIFSLDWVVNGPPAPYFTALDKGYYKEEGLEVKILRGYGSGDAVKRVATGASTFAFGDAGMLVLDFLK